MPPTPVDGMGAPAGRFGAVLTAMVTPFDDAGRIDIGGAVELCRHLGATGTDAVVAAGTTGESPALSDDEKLELWRALVAEGGLPVIAGATGNDTAHSVEMVEKATAAGAAAILAVTPYYNRPPQSGIEAHFRAVAAATDLPVMLYDIPIRAGRRIAPEVIIRLGHDVANVVAVKDATGDVAGTARLVAETPADFDIYCGDDNLTLPMLAVGAVGVVSVAAHWAGPELATMINAFLAGEVSTAAEINRVLFASYAFETGDDAPNPLPTKAMMRVMGLPAGQCRLPLGDAPAGTEEQAKQVLADLEAWRDGGQA